MKLIIKLSLITLGGILPLAGQVTETTETTERSRNADGSVTETQTTTTQSFNPEARRKVVTHFEAYRTNPYGLPPAISQKVRVREIPSAWKTTRISPGVVVTEANRQYLVEAPADLVRVLPAPSGGVRYYVAGSNVVAVDNTFKVVDSVHIPTIKYKEDGDEVEIESKQGGTTTKTEIDKDDGEVEVEKEQDN